MQSRLKMWQKTFERTKTLYKQSYHFIKLALSCTVPFRSDQTQKSFPAFKLHAKIFGNCLADIG